MSERYDHKKIEKKWQERWEQSHAFAADDASKKEKSYLLVEFPYPSGNLHVGHWYAFSVPDICARYLRMRGKNVLFPIGFDAFGLPAENAAIKRGLNPRKWTYENMDFMRTQIKSMGASFDWSREVVTCDPKYYRWTQWQFIELFKRGLVYRKETAVNWCPVDKTVLANEQVVSGHCERCGAEVEQRLMPQWNIKITDYADRLIDDLEPLNWPRQIKESQINWIGRSEGAEIDFVLNREKAHITVFTTRADTLFGATFLVLAPEHPWVTLVTDVNHDVLENKAEVKTYIDATKKKTEIERTAEGKEKTGVELKGVKAINPANGEEIPMFVADYVLGNYGTGAIMAVPAHDERDFAFAKKFDLQIKEVIEPMIEDGRGEDAIRPELPFVERDIVACIVKHWSEDLYMCLRVKKNGWQGFVFGGIEAGEDPIHAGQREIAEETGYTHARFVKKVGGKTHSKFYHPIKGVNRFGHFECIYFQLEDGERKEIEQAEKDLHNVLWLSSDQVESFLNREGLHILWRRLHGEEIYTGPGIVTNSGKFDGIDSEEAKKKITEFVGGRVTKKYHLRDWVVSRQRYWGVPIPMIFCKMCAAKEGNDGWSPVPENQLPVVLPEVEDYLPTGDGKSPLAKVRDWVEVPCPSCGKPAERETDTLDTFVDSSWYYLRYTDPNDEQEFANKKNIENWMPVDLYSGGSEHTTMHVLYSRFWHKALFDAGYVNTSEPYTRRMNRGLIMGPDGQKMSKSKGNVIDPDEVVKNLGADTVRTYMAFIGPYNEVGAYPWNPNGAVGVRRFLERVWNLSEKVAAVAVESATESLLHQTIRKVGDDIESLKMNTAVSALMVLSNHLHDLAKVPKETYATFLALLTPFAPHIAHELAEKIGLERTTWEHWPQFDPTKAQQQSVLVAVQINGKVRATLEMAPDLSEDEALSTARSDIRIAKWLEGVDVVKAIYVPGKVINFVRKGH